MISIVMRLDATEKRNLPPNFFLNTACKARWVVIYILRSNLYISPNYLRFLINWIKKVILRKKSI